MDEQKAHELHTQMKAAGPGPGKQGLGFSSRPPPPAVPAGGPPPGGPMMRPPGPPPPGYGGMPQGPPGMPYPPYGHPPPPHGYFRPPPGMPPFGYMAPPYGGYPPGMPPGMPLGMPPYGQRPPAFQGRPPPPPGGNMRPPPQANHVRPPPQSAASARPPPGGNMRPPFRPGGPTGGPHAAAAAAAAKREEEEKAKRAADGWSAYKAEDDRLYFYNQVTGESSWERPEGYTGDEDKASSNPVPMSSERVAGTDWLEVKCDDGKKYWYNSKNDETTWHVPPEVESRQKMKLDPARAKMLERARAMGATVAPEFEEQGVGVGAAAAAAAPEEDEDVFFTEEDLGFKVEPDPEPADAAGAAEGAAEGQGAAAGEAPDAAAGGSAEAPAGDMQMSPQREQGAPPQQAQQAQQAQQQQYPPLTCTMPPGGQMRPPQFPGGMPPPSMPPPLNMPPPPPYQQPPPQYQQQPPHPGMMGPPGGMMGPPAGMMPPHPGYHNQRPPGPGMHPRPMGGPGGVPMGHQPPMGQHPGGPSPGMYRHSQQQQQQQGPPAAMMQQPAPPPRVKTGFGPDGFMVKEEAVEEFKSLLAEKGVHAFSRYERELPKLQGDKRFKYLPSVAERKAAFEAFCSESATAKKKAGGGKAGGAGSGRAAAAAPPPPSRASADFERLLDEVERACSGRGDTAAGTAGGEEGQILLWDGDLTLDSLEERWGADPRWQAVPPGKRTAALEACVAPLREAAKKLREGEYRALLREHGVRADSRWSRTKDDLSADPRYLALPRDDREDLFRAYVAELLKVEERQQEREAKQLHAERRLEAERRAADARRQQAAHGDAVTHYKALLQELHLTPDARWRDYEQRVRRDPQGRGTSEALERGEAESLFRDHVAALYEEGLDAFLDLMDKEIKPLIPDHEQQQTSGLPKPLIRWADAVPLLEDDERFTRLSDLDRERAWRRYVDDELFNRDHPLMRPRTQRKQKGRVGPGGGPGGGEGEDGPGAGIGGGGGVGTRRPRPLPPTDEGGMDKAYQREYIAADAKRARRD